MQQPVRIPVPCSSSHCLQASRNSCLVQNECTRFSSTILVTSVLEGLNTSRCLSSVASRNLALSPTFAEQKHVGEGYSCHEQLPANFRGGVKYQPGTEHIKNERADRNHTSRTLFRNAVPMLISSFDPAEMYTLTIFRKRLKTFSTGFCSA